MQIIKFQEEKFSDFSLHRYLEQSLTDKLPNRQFVQMVSSFETIEQEIKECEQELDFFCLIYLADKKTLYIFYGFNNEILRELKQHVNLFSLEQLKQLINFIPSAVHCVNLVLSMPQISSELLFALQERIEKNQEELPLELYQSYFGKISGYGTRAPEELTGLVTQLIGAHFYHPTHCYSLVQKIAEKLQLKLDETVVTDLPGHILVTQLIGRINKIIRDDHGEVTEKRKKEFKKYLELYQSTISEKKETNLPVLPTPNIFVNGVQGAGGMLEEVGEIEEKLTKPITEMTLKEKTLLFKEMGDVWAYYNITANFYQLSVKSLIDHANLDAIPWKKENLMEMMTTALKIINLSVYEGGEKRIKDTTFPQLVHSMCYYLSLFNGLLTEMKISHKELSAQNWIKLEHRLDKNTLAGEGDQR